MNTEDRYQSVRGTWQDAEELAAARNFHSSHDTYLPCDNGAHVSPRYGVIRAFKINDEVSKGFNGDYYPEGVIVTISASNRIIATSTGLKFYRRKNSGSWVSGGTWYLVPGHINERNPSF